MAVNRLEIVPGAGSPSCDNWANPQVWSDMSARGEPLPSLGRTRLYISEYREDDPNPQEDEGTVIFTSSDGQERVLRPDPDGDSSEPLEDQRTQILFGNGKSIRVGFESGQAIGKAMGEGVRIDLGTLLAANLVSRNPDA